MVTEPCQGCRVMGVCVTADEGEVCGCGSRAALVCCRAAAAAVDSTEDCKGTGCRRRYPCVVISLSIVMTGMTSGVFPET